MSALSGLGAKGEKGKGKFTSININNIYKGTSASTQKSTGRLKQRKGELAWFQTKPQELLFRCDHFMGTVVKSYNR